MLCITFLFKLGLGALGIIWYAITCWKVWVSIAIVLLTGFGCIVAESNGYRVAMVIGAVILLLLIIF